MTCFPPRPQETKATDSKNKGTGAVTYLRDGYKVWSLQNIEDRAESETRGLGGDLAGRNITSSDETVRSHLGSVDWAVTGAHPGVRKCLGL